MIVNPDKPFRRPAMLRFLYREEWRPDYPRATPGELGAGYDALSLLGRFLDDYPFARGALLQFAMKRGYASGPDVDDPRSEEHTSELQSLMRNSYAVFCLKKKKRTHKI